jgi:hypothetical protein
MLKRGYFTARRLGDGRLDMPPQWTTNTGKVNGMESEASLSVSISSDELADAEVVV